LNIIKRCSQQSARARVRDRGNEEDRYPILLGAVVLEGQAVVLEVHQDSKGLRIFQLEALVARLGADDHVELLLDLRDGQLGIEALEIAQGALDNGMRDLKLKRHSFMTYSKEWWADS